MTGGMFDEFANVEVREEKETPKSDLDLILDAETEIIKQCENDERIKQYGGSEHEAYQSLYKKTQEKVADINITPKLLQEYIDTRNNPEKNMEAIIRGMYSAALLEIISTKTPETHTLIDGKGKKFNYLFYYIHNVKNLTLHNITGDDLLANAGSNRGSASHITLQNITGHNTLYNVGMNGSAIHITLHDITGHYALSCAGSYDGSVEHITLQNIKGNYTLTNASSNNGSAKNITLTNIIGHNTLANASSNKGSAKNITLTNITGVNTLKNTGWNGSIKNILRENKLTGKQKLILSQIETIVNTMHAHPFEEQKKMHDEIARLQIKLFEGERE